MHCAGLAKGFGKLSLTCFMCPLSQTAILGNAGVGALGCNCPDFGVFARNSHPVALWCSRVNGRFVLRPPVDRVKCCGLRCQRAGFCADGIAAGTLGTPGSGTRRYGRGRSDTSEPGCAPPCFCRSEVQGSGDTMLPVRPGRRHGLRIFLTAGAIRAARHRRQSSAHARMSRDGSRSPPAVLCR